jgi:ubiquitin-protein ligase
MNRNEHIDQKIDKLIEEERNTAFNPYLSTRVMAALEHRETKRLFTVKRKWQPVLAMAGVLVAVILGIAAGNLYSSADDETGSVLSNDSQTENFAFYLQTEKEE